MQQTEKHWKRIKGTNLEIEVKSDTDKRRSLALKTLFGAQAIYSSSITYPCVCGYCQRHSSTQIFGGLFGL